MARKTKKQGSGKRQKTDLDFAPELVAFFRAAGVKVDSEKGWILVKGRRALRAPRTRASYVDWDSVIDQVALGHCPDLLIDALRRNGHLLGEETKAYLVRERGSFELRRGDRRIALVRPTRAVVSGQGRIRGNFLIDGDHWKKLGAAIKRYETAEREAAREPEPIQVEAPGTPRSLLVLASPPDGASEEVIEACLKASASIRLERSIAYDHPVVLETAEGTLKFLPISGPEHALRVHFEFDLEGGVVKGRLDLFGNDDPLSVRVAPDTSESLLPRAWASALLGFAAISCFTLPPRQPRTDGARRASGLWRSSSRGKFRQPSSLSRRRFWPNHLEPTGAWVRHGPSFVPGHRRRLNDGRRASPEAQARARRVGITLAPNETWVQPHTRGLPDDADLRFRWRAPDVLRPRAA